MSISGIKFTHASNAVSAFMRLISHVFWFRWMPLSWQCPRPINNSRTTTTRLFLLFIHSWWPPHPGTLRIETKRGISSCIRFSSDQKHHTDNMQLSFQKRFYTKDAVTQSRRWIKSLLKVTFLACQLYLPWYSHIFVCSTAVASCFRK